jgi:hypothetical protein
MIGSLVPVISLLLPQTCEAGMLTLLMGQIYEVCTSHGLRWHDVYVSRIELILALLPQ